MPDQRIIPLRPGAAGYSDAAALNDIHAILTAADPGGEGALADIAQVLTRAGRPLVAVRDIEITMTETASGWPVARARAGDTTVVIRQAPAAARLLVEVTTTSPAERDALAVTLDGRTLHPARGGDAA
jgi:hypothetical protein